MKCLLLLETLDDVNNYSKWLAFSKSVRLLKTEENQKYVYLEINFPWPSKGADNRTTRDLIQG
jgi:hypothetical protein